MKIRIHHLLAISFVVVALLGVVFCATWKRFYAYQCGGTPSGLFASDLLLRINESACAHLGVNSYHIWNGDVSVEGFFPYMRPDRPMPIHSATDRPVHSYPAWHQALFYFYGYFPPNVDVAIMAIVFGLCLSVIWMGIVRYCMEFTNHPVVCAIGIVMPVTYYATECFFWMNYGVLILALVFLTGRLLSKGEERWREIVAGLLWGVAFVKPQVAALFVWPLWFRRKYISIATAFCFLCLLTVAMSFRYCENPLLLILQVPKIGAPYMRPLLASVFGSCGTWLKMGLFSLGCGFLCYRLRFAKTWYYCCAPVALCLPLWTYSMVHDRVLYALWFCVVAAELCRANPFARSRWISYVVFCIFYCLYEMSFGLGPWLNGVGVSLVANVTLKMVVSRTLKVLWFGWSFVMLFRIVARQPKKDSLR